MPATTRGQANRQQARDKSVGTIPRATFTSLPPEILVSIACHLDLPSAFSLAQTSKQFPAIIENRLWRNLDVSIIDDRFHQSKGSVLGGVKLADRHKAAVAARVQDILQRGNPGRYRAVESLKVMPRPGPAKDDLMSLLHLVARHLRSLTFTSAFQEHGWEDFEDEDNATLDFLILESGMRFPSLTHVTIHCMSTQHLEFLPLLCNIAPGLIWLDADLSQPHIPSPDDIHVNRFPTFESNTAIRHLRVDFGDLAPDEDHTVEHEDIDPDHIVVRLLRHCPLTEQLQIGYNRNLDRGGEIFDHLRNAMREWRNLRDLFWQAWSGELRDTYLFDEPQDFSSLRRCILEPREFINFFENLPWGESLHHVHFYILHRLHPDPAVTYPSIPADILSRLDDVQHAPPIFYEHIRQSPFLRYITFGSDITHNAFECFEQLDELVRSGKASGFVDSFRHGEKEVLQVRLLIPWLEIHDANSDTYHTVGMPETPTSSCLDYYHDGVDRSRTFEQLPSAVWQTFTDYEGKVVPLEVLDRMRVVQGLNVEEWQQRGVEVGDAAWKVLMDWYDGLVDAGEVGEPE